MAHLFESPKYRQSLIRLIDIVRNTDLICDHVRNVDVDKIPTFSERRLVVKDTIFRLFFDGTAKNVDGSSSSSNDDHWISPTSPPTTADKEDQRQDVDPGSSSSNRARFEQPDMVSLRASMNALKSSWHPMDERSKIGFVYKTSVDAKVPTLAVTSSGLLKEAHMALHLQRTWISRRLFVLASIAEMLESPAAEDDSGVVALDRLLDQLYQLSSFPFAQVHCLDIGPEGHVRGIIMESLKSNLKEYVVSYVTNASKTGSDPGVYDTITELCHQTINAVSALHHCNVAHMDLKYRNIGVGTACITPSSSTLKSCAVPMPIFRGKTMATNILAEADLSFPPVSVDWTRIEPLVSNRLKIIDFGSSLIHCPRLISSNGFPLEMDVSEDACAAADEFSTPPAAPHLFGESPCSRSTKYYVATTWNYMAPERVVSSLKDEKSIFPRAYDVYATGIMCLGMLNLSPSAWFGAKNEDDDNSGVFKNMVSINGGAHRLALCMKMSPLSDRVLVKTHASDVMCEFDPWSGVIIDQHRGVGVGANGEAGSAAGGKDKQAKKQKQKQEHQKYLPPLEQVFSAMHKKSRESVQQDGLDGCALCKMVHSDLQEEEQQRSGDDDKKCPPRVASAREALAKGLGTTISLSSFVSYEFISMSCPLSIEDESRIDHMDRGEAVSKPSIILSRPPCISCGAVKTWSDTFTSPEEDVEIHEMQDVTYRKALLPTISLKYLSSDGEESSGVADEEASPADVTEVDIQASNAVNTIHPIVEILHFANTCHQYGINPLPIILSQDWSEEYDDIVKESFSPLLVGYGQDLVIELMTVIYCLRLIFWRQSAQLMSTCPPSPALRRTFFCSLVKRFVLGAESVGTAGGGVGGGAKGGKTQLSEKKSVAETIASERLRGAAVEAYVEGFSREWSLSVRRSTHYTLDRNFEHESMDSDVKYACWAMTNAEIIALFSTVGWVSYLSHIRNKIRDLLSIIIPDPSTTPLVVIRTDPTIAFKFSHYKSYRGLMARLACMLHINPRERWMPSRSGQAGGDVLVNQNLEDATSSPVLYQSINGRLNVDAVMLVSEHYRQATMQPTADDRDMFKILTKSVLHAFDADATLSEVRSARLVALLHIRPRLRLSSDHHRAPSFMGGYDKLSYKEKVACSTRMEKSVLRWSSKMSKSDATNTSAAHMRHNGINTCWLLAMQNWYRLRGEWMIETSAEEYDESEEGAAEGDAMYKMVMDVALICFSFEAAAHTLGLAGYVYEWSNIMACAITAAMMDCDDSMAKTGREWHSGIKRFAKRINARLETIPAAGGLPCRVPDSAKVNPPSIVSLAAWDSHLETLRVEAYCEDFGLESPTDVVDDEDAFQEKRDASSAPGGGSRMDEDAAKTQDGDDDDTTYDEDDSGDDDEDDSDDDEDDSDEDEDEDDSDEDEDDSDEDTTDEDDDTDDEEESDKDKQGLVKKASDAADLLEQLFASNFSTADEVCHVDKNKQQQLTTSIPQILFALRRTPRFSHVMSQFTPMSPLVVYMESCPRLISWIANADISPPSPASKPSSKKKSVPQPDAWNDIDAPNKRLAWFYEACLTIIPDMQTNNLSVETVVWTIAAVAASRVDSPTVDARQCIALFSASVLEKIVTSAHHWMPAFISTVSAFRITPAGPSVMPVVDSPAIDIFADMASDMVGKKQIRAVLESIALNHPSTILRRGSVISPK